MSGYNYSTPSGVEYEKLLKTLKDRTMNKYYKDYRIKKEKKEMPLLNPGMLVEYETNMFSPYIQTNGPYSDGSSWIGGLYE